MITKEPTTKADKICAVVVTFNRKVLLEECLTALLNQTRRLDEVIVIDNASADGTDRLMKTKFAGTTYVKLAENIGGAGGFHEGTKLAHEKGYDWIWVMDDDAIPMLDALQRLLDCPVRLAEKVYALASAVLNPDKSVCLHHRRLFNEKKSEEKEVALDEYKQNYFRMDSASFVGLLLNHKAIDEVGLPLKEFFIYFDDTEYCLRIRKKGLMFTVPDSKIVHGEIRSNSKLQVSKQQSLSWKDYYGFRNQIYTYRKYGTPSLAFYLKLVVRTLRFAGNLLLFGHSRLESIKIFLYGTLDGLRGNLGKNSNFLPH